MMLDEKLPLNEWKAYNENLNAIIDNPADFGFDDTIIPVCQFLAYFCPVNPPCNNFANMTSVQIIDELAGIVDVDINTVCRLMLTLGYKIYYKGSPEWSMMRAVFED